jgi:hypothetical protein
VGKCEGKISLRTHRASWEDNIKMDIRIGWDGGTGIDVVLDRERGLL